MNVKIMSIAVKCK